MFGLIIFVVVLSIIGGLFSRPRYGYYRSRIYPFGGFSPWGMGYRHHGPMCHGHHHPHMHMHHHMGHGHHHHMGHGPMGHGRMW